MVWRSIIILTAHLAAAILAWSGFSWLLDGIGLNPLIAFPAAVIVYVWSWVWIASEAAQAEQDIYDYLEYMEIMDKSLEDFWKHDQGTEIHEARKDLFKALYQQAQLFLRAKK